MIYQLIETLGKVDGVEDNKRIHPPVMKRRTLARGLSDDIIKLKAKASRVRAQKDEFIEHIIKATLNKIWNRDRDYSMTKDVSPLAVTSWTRLPLGGRSVPSAQV